MAHPSAPGNAWLSSNAARDLLRAARQARAHAYAPYSGFPVGAALVDVEGELYTGVNVENVSFGLTICAEQAAVAKAISEGARHFSAIAIVGPDDDRPTPPCGRCRQILLELAPALIVITAGADAPHQVPIERLLPDAFDLERSRPPPGTS